MALANTSKAARPALSPGVWEYELDTGSLAVDAVQVERRMAVTSSAALGPLRRRIPEVLEEAAAHVRVRAGYRILLEPALTVQERGFRLTGAPFRTGPAIAAALSGCTCMSVFTATLGPAFDAWLASLGERGDAATACVANAAGDALAAGAGRWIRARISETAAHAGLDVTRAFSPAVGAWGLCERAKLFSLLPPRFCGVTLTEASMMRPSKSVSGVVGIGAGLDEAERPRSLASPASGGGPT